MEYPHEAAPSTSRFTAASGTGPSAPEVVQDPGQSAPRRRPAWLRGLVLGALLLVALAVIGPDVSMPNLSPGSATPLYPGVRAREATVLVRGTPSAPVGELAFLAVEPGGFVVATDRVRKTIYRFDPSGARVAEWGPRLGGSTVPLGEPAGIALAGDGSYYVVDRDPQRVVRVDSTGSARSVLDLKPYGPYGLNGVAVDRDGGLYVADTGRNRILLLSPEGQLRAEIGRGGGRDPGRFMQPMQVAFSPEDGALLVTDWENARVQRFAPAPELTHTDAWPTGYRSFGLAADERGRVYVADPGRRLVQAYAPRTGVLLGEVGGPGSIPVDVPGLVQVAVAPLSSGAMLYALGPQTIARIELEDTPPPPQPGGGLLSLLGEVFDPSTAAAAAAFVLVALLVLDRNRRRQALRAS